MTQPSDQAPGAIAEEIPKAFVEAWKTYYECHLHGPEDDSCKEERDLDWKDGWPESFFYRAGVAAERERSVKAEELLRRAIAHAPIVAIQDVWDIEAFLAPAHDRREGDSFLRSSPGSEKGKP